MGKKLIISLRIDYQSNHMRSYPREAAARYRSKLLMSEELTSPAAPPRIVRFAPHHFLRVPAQLLLIVIL